MSKDRIEKILVPLDGSKNSFRGLDMAIIIAKPHAATITGLEVVPITFSYGIPFSNKIQKRSRKKAERNLESALKKTKRRGVEFRKKIQFGGNIGNSIIKFAKENKFDLIVLGSRGPDPGFEIFLGSVANYVIHKSKIPVLLVK